MGTQLPSPKRGRDPSQFSADVHCGQTAGCIKMPLGMEVGLSPADFGLDGDPVPSPKKGVEPPIFGPCLLWPNGCMHQDATWHGGGPWSRPHCAKWGPAPSPKRGTAPPSSPQKKRHSPHPIFGPYLLWPKHWVNEDATW